MLSRVGHGLLSEFGHHEIIRLDDPGIDYRHPLDSASDARASRRRRPAWRVGTTTNNRPRSCRSEGFRPIMNSLTSEITEASHPRKCLTTLMLPETLPAFLNVWRSPGQWEHSSLICSRRSGVIAAEAARKVTFSPTDRNKKSLFGRYSRTP